MKRGSSYGKIIGIWSCMYARKTTTAQQYVARAMIGNRSVIMMIPTCEDRFTTKALSVSHDHLQIMATRIDTLVGVNYDDYEPYETIVIDEAQFLDGVLEFCLELKRRGKKVVVAGLRSDFRNKPWPNTVELMGIHCDEHVDLKGVCFMCGDDAIYTRLLEGEGVHGKYVCCCLEHYTEPIAIDPKILDQRTASLERIRHFQKE